MRLEIQIPSQMMGFLPFSPFFPAALALWDGATVQ